MADPGYDFFAVPASGTTGAEPEPARAHPETAPAVLTPPPSPTMRAAGYDPGLVNQFGTPLTAVVAPTGPYAAPGIAVVPTSGPGMVSTRDGVGPHARARSGSMDSPVKPGAVTAAGVLVRQTPVPEQPPPDQPVKA